MPPTEHTATVNGIRLYYRRSGEGPPVVLLHGYPQTGYCWRHVAADLARDHTVIVPDLRGYGRSDKALNGMDKRTMATDVSALVHDLDLGRVAVVGHDRGGRVAHRWALDRPDEVERIALLDIPPAPAVLDRMNAELADRYWHWWFTHQPDLPELLVGANVEGYLRYFFEHMTVVRHAVDADAVAEYVRAFSQPGALRSAFDDYRADPVDAAHNAADLAAGHRLTMPLLVLWSKPSSTDLLPMLPLWRDYGDDVRGHGIAGAGHYLPEEAPQEVADHLRKFLA